MSDTLMILNLHDPKVEIARYRIHTFFQVVVYLLRTENPTHLSIETIDETGKFYGLPAWSILYGLCQTRGQRSKWLRDHVLPLVRQAQDEVCYAYGQHYADTNPQRELENARRLWSLR